MVQKLCIDQECEPPFGGKEDCEFYQNGICIGKGQNDLSVIFSNVVNRQSVNKLNPCPKCGRNQKRTVPVKCNFETRYKVRCSNCGFEIDLFESKKEAYAVWNDLQKGTL